MSKIETMQDYINMNRIIPESQWTAEDRKQIGKIRKEYRTEKIYFKGYNEEGEIKFEVGGF